MQFWEEVKTTLWNFIDDMSLKASGFTVNPDKDFTRKKKWYFATLMEFIISMESQSLKNEFELKMNTKLFVIWLTDITEC